MQEPTASQLIKRLFSVIAMGVAAAIAVAVFFIYFFSPGGSYPVSELLVNPQIAKELRYQVDGKTFIFDRVELLHYSDRNNSWETKKVNLEQYQNFYSIIKNDKSEAIPDDAVKNSFYQVNPAILSIVVRREGAEADQVFQEVQISTTKGVYRVKLREEQVLPQWAYFTHDNIYQKALDALGIK